MPDPYDRTVIDTLNAIEKMARKIYDFDESGEDAHHEMNNALQSCVLLELEACTFPAGHYINEKIASLKSHLRSLAGFGDRGGHSRRQHHVWVLSDLVSLQTKLTFGQGRGRSAHED